MQGDTSSLTVLRVVSKALLGFRVLWGSASHPVSQQGRQGLPEGCEVGFVSVRLPILGGEGQGHGELGLQ